MPGFDGTGPAGRGPMTGRGRGFCVERIAEEGDTNGETPLARPAGRPFVSGRSLVIPGGKEANPMPWGDGTGPAGMGPMTGRAAGYCAGFPVPGYMNPTVGWGGYGAVPYGGVMAPGYPRAPYGVAPRGFGGWGRGWGFGFGRGLAWRRGRGRAYGRGRWFAPAAW